MTHDGAWFFIAFLIEVYYESRRIAVGYYAVVIGR